MTFFRQDIMWVSTQTALLYYKTFPKFSKQSLIVFFFFFVESKREDVFFAKWRIYFTEYLPEMCFHIFLHVYCRERAHCVEIKILLEPVANLRTEFRPDILLPMILLILIIPRIEREDKQEIYIVMKQQQGVTVKQPVLELLRHIPVIFSVSFLNTINRITIFLIH